MSFNRKVRFALILAGLALVVSCNEKEKKIPAVTPDLNSPEAMIMEAKKLLGDETQLALQGSFDEDTTKEMVAGTEINKPDKWGIRFHLLKKKGSSFEDIYSTNLLEGSFTDGMVRKEKFASVKYDLVYYNSLDYYLGSGGGEVFAYLIDFNKKQTYYSHLFIERGRSISLYLSENVTPDVKNFFLNVFKKDYPDLRIVTQDVDLDD